MLCCRNAYNMVINKFGDRLYKGLVETITRHLQVTARQRLDGCFSLRLDLPAAGLF